MIITNYLFDLKGKGKKLFDTDILLKHRVELVAEKLSIV